MHNDLMGLDRRPFCIWGKNGENFAMYSCRFDFKFESLNQVKVQLEPLGFQPGVFSF